jgi:ABC-type glycerol-3-phosphate transport system substrate-binding protein
MNKIGSRRNGRSLPRLLHAVVIVLVAALVAACGGQAPSPTGDGDVKTVVIWDRAGAQATIKQKWFEIWNANEGKQAGVKVSYEPQAADKYEEIVRVAFQTKRAPDILTTPSSQLGGFVAAGWLQPLDEVLDQSVLDANQSYLGKNSELVWGGKPYAIPTISLTNRLLINRELFTQAGLDPDSPPTTYSELAAASKKIAAVSPGKTYGFGMPIKWVGFRQWIVDLPIMAGDPDVTNGLFNQTSATYESTKYAAMVQTYRQLIADKSAYPGAATLEQDVTWAAFAKGEVGMIVTSSAVVAAMTQLKSTVDAVAAPLPVADGTTLVRSPMNAGYPYGISSTTADPEAAGVALQALAGDGVQQALAKGDTPPLSPTVWNSAIMKDKKLLMSFRPGPTDQQWPKNPNAVVAVEGQTVDQTIVSLVLKPELPVDSTLADLQKRYQAAYDKAVADGELEPGEFTR